MANDEMDNGSSVPEEESKQGDESGGLGNLPPLSDFDSGEVTEEMASDSGLPPLSSFDSDPDKEEPQSQDSADTGDTGDLDGLPSLDEINVETPKPAGGNVKPAPPGYEEFNTPQGAAQGADAQGADAQGADAQGADAQGAPAQESPPQDAAGQEPGGQQQENTSFQDLSADSDFSPATPQVGPGPDSDMDTPMLDSAFGGGEGGGGFSPTFETPAPTQAMETPLFGETPKPPADTPEPAFDEGAFSPGGGFDVGTPMPDFSPDTAAPVPQATPAEAGKAPGKAKKGKKKLSLPSGNLTVIGIIVGALIVGLLAGPYVSNMVTVLPNPLKSVVSEQQEQIDQLTSQNKRLMASQTEEGKPAVSQDMIDELLDQKEQLDASIKELTAQETEARAEYEQTAQQLDSVRADLEAQNEEFVTAQEAYENLKNEMAIVQARKMGVAAEVEQLTDMVGKLDEANQRSRATKDTLEHSIERMAVQIREGLPLTPEKYSRSARLAAVQELKERVAEAKWVTPALLDTYTTLYNRELEIAEVTAYFFAKIPVTSNLGDMRQKWAECLMKGNNEVLYRTLDGKNVGVYAKVENGGGQESYSFVEDLPEPVQKSVEQEVMAFRSEGFEEQLNTLAEKQELIDGPETPFQRIFNSLN